MAGMQPGHQHAARGRTHGLARVELCKPHALGGKTVKMRCQDELLPVTAEFTVTEIVGEDEDDVGLRLLGERDSRDPEEPHEKRCPHGSF